MTYEWGRAPEAGRWQRAMPVWFLSLLVLALAGGVGLWLFRQTFIWTPLQQFYLSVYARSAVASSLGIQTGRYRVLLMENRRGSRLAIDDEVAPITLPTGKTTFTLSELAQAAKSGRLVWRDLVHDHARLHAELRVWIYADQTVTELARPSLIAVCAVFVAGSLIAIPKDARGGPLAAPWATVEGAGVRIRPAVQSPDARQRDRVSPDYETAGQAARYSVSALDPSCHRIESSPHHGRFRHGKIRAHPTDAQSAGGSWRHRHRVRPGARIHAAVLRARTGDVILNPLDARSPYWSPGDELRHDAEALTLATSLFPDRANENPFFTEGPRRIFAHLLTFRPTAEELASWLCHDEELDRRVHGTPYASIIDRQAPAQRSGVLAALNMVADTLKLLPPESLTIRRWSAVSWAQDRRGWLFLTSTPETRTRLVPLTSLWLDMLVLRLMNRGQPGHRPVWFVLDELASLQRLPQLHTAVTENRKSNNPVVLGFQGRSQLETRYGHDAEAMLSQPATKIFLRTSEPNAAKWISDTIGEVEIERMRESRSKGRYGQRSFGLERQVEPLVMPSEISGLPSLPRVPEAGKPRRPTAFPLRGCADAASRIRGTSSQWIRRDR